MVRCHKCGNVAKVTKTKYGDRNSCCGMWSWGDYPLEDSETHRLRKEAHIHFDKIWKSKAMTRSESYLWLADKTKIKPSKCHIKLMNKEELKKVIDISKIKIKEA